MLVDIRVVRKIGNKSPYSSDFGILSSHFIISTSSEELSAEGKRCRNGVGRKMCCKSISSLSPTPQDRLLGFDEPAIRHVMCHVLYFGILASQVPNQISARITEGHHEPDWHVQSRLRGSMGRVTRASVTIPILVIYPIKVS